MSEQDAIERVAKALHAFDWNISWEEVPEVGDWCHYGDEYREGKTDYREQATAAIQEYNAYLRERAQDADVVKAGARRFQDMLVEWENDAMNKSVTNDPGTDSNAYELANATITAALDVLLGKEADDDR